MARKNSLVIGIALSIFWIFAVLGLLGISDIRFFYDAKVVEKIVFLTFGSSLFLPILLYYFASHECHGKNLKILVFSPFAFTVIIILQHVKYRIQ